MTAPLSTSSEYETAPTGTKLAGKVAVVVGGGSAGAGIGIGRAICLACAGEGATVAVLDLDRAAADETVRLIGDDTAWSVPVDVSDDHDVRRAFAEIVERAGGIDVLVNVVGVTAAGTAVDLAIEDWDRIMRIDVRAMMLTARNAIPSMVERGGGSIVNIASNAGMNGMPGLLAYSTAKAAVINMTRSMAVDHGRAGVRVNCIPPGPIPTPSNLGRGLTDATRRAWQDVTLLGVEGSPWDIARATVFLASDDARWITGAIVPVDGGVSAAMRWIPNA